jgi:ubiquinone/menaquinone biosynthesis C-methylase UbiE
MGDASFKQNPNVNVHPKIETAGRSRSAFNNAAPSYDDEFERLPATRRLRDIIWRTYYEYFRPGDSLLELNCGTGTDAMELAASGIHVLATDASEEMIKEAERKLASTGLHAFVETRQLSFHRLHQLKGKVFDGAYSNFGGLNCTRRLDYVARSIAPLIRPGGFLVLCMLSKFSLWEMLSFLARLQFAKAFRRFPKDGTLADVHGEKVWVHYYSPKEIVGIFSAGFIPVAGYGLNIFSPPPNSRLASRVLGPLARLLERLDDLIAQRKPFYALGDHFVIVLQRKN